MGSNPTLSANKPSLDTQPLKLVSETLFMTQNETGAKTDECPSEGEISGSDISLGLSSFLEPELSRPEQTLERELFTEDDERAMRSCIRLGAEAATRGEVPVGALVVHEDPESGARRVIAVGFNLRETTHDPTAHAEIVAMRRAAQLLGQWRLDECTLYVTLEPCPMCAGAIVNARVRRVVYGCDDPKAGAGRSLYTLMTDTRLNHRVELQMGLFAHECAQLLKEFFARRRQEKKRAKLQRQQQ